ADSPVIAASSTLAIPSTTSPSAGIMSPASHTTRSPFCNAGAGTCCSRPFHRRRAIVSFRAFLKLAACALPRPSATASAKLAKSTVNQSQIASCVTNPRSPDSAVKIPTVVRAAPTMVTNMTGFFTISRGFSFLNASPIAGPTMFQSKSEAGFCVIKIGSILKKFSALHEEVLDDWPEGQRGEKIERADQEDRAEKQNQKRAAGDWKR